VADFADRRRKAPADGSARYGEHMDQRSAEPVRLVIWDLDETFWKGTLTEGGITFSPENRDVVIALTERGIISTICSKNDLEPVRDILKQHDVWDYFVFPSVNWEPKGPRLQALIEAIQLRAETVMLIDDNPMNRNEALFFVPGIQVADETGFCRTRCSRARTTMR